MKRATLVLALLGALAPALPAPAQEARLRGSVELGGQWSPRRAGTDFNPGGTLIDAGSHAAGAAARVQAQATQGALRATLDAWAEARRQDGSDAARLVLSEAVLEAALSDAASVAAGVGLARWGTGYAWNPANPVLDPEANNTSRARAYRRDGDGFVRLESGFGRDSAGLYLTYFRQNDPLLSPRREREWMLYGRYQHVLDGGDLTGLAGLGPREQFAGAAASATVGDQLELHGELGLRSRRRAPGLETVAVPLPGGPQPLASWSFEPRRRATPALLLGGQYTFDDGANLIAEYFYNGNGYSDSDFGALRRAAADGRALLGGPLEAAGQGFLLDANRLVGRLRRHYLFLRVARDEVARGTDLHYYLRVGLADGAQVHGALLRHALSQNLSAQFGAEVYAGPQRSEARLIPVRRRVEATLTLNF